MLSSLAIWRVSPDSRTSTLRKTTLSASRAMRARDAESCLHCSLLFSVPATLLRSQTSSLITHSSSDSMASMMSLSPARVNAASSSARLWICLVLLSTLSDSASRLAWTESYPWLMHTVARGLREEGACLLACATRRATGAMTADEASWAAIVIGCLCCVRTGSGDAVDVSSRMTRRVGARSAISFSSC